MIRCEKGETQIEGTTIELLGEYAAVTSVLKKCIPPEWQGVLTKAHESGMQLEKGTEKEVTEYFIKGILEVAEDIDKNKKTMFFKMD